WLAAILRERLPRRALLLQELTLLQRAMRSPRLRMFRQLAHIRLPSRSPFPRPPPPPRYPSITAARQIPLWQVSAGICRSDIPSRSHEMYASALLNGNSTRTGFGEVRP